MSNPKIINTPFAINGNKNEILDNERVEPNNPTWQQGWDDTTSTPINSGGLPPKREDFNGVLYAITDNIVHQTKGLGYDFDLAFATKIGGYPLGARLQIANGTIVESTSNNNMNNPNSNMVGWKIPTGGVGIVESVTDLLNISGAKDGELVEVLHFDKASGRLHGGGKFVFNEEKSTVNDESLCFNGWERQLVLDTYTPYMSGCYGDGVTDDVQNLDKLMYTLEVNNLSGTLVMHGDFFFNSQCPRTGKMIDPVQFNEKNAIRLVDDVDLLITSSSTLKFGSFYQGTPEQPKCNLLSAMYRADSSDWYGKNKHKNINIYGGGKLDFTETASPNAPQDGYRWICKASVENMKIFGLNFEGGDFANAFQSSKTSTDIEIFDNKFTNLVSDTSLFHDHSTIYCIGKDIKVHDNTFTFTNVKGRLNSCACELHGSEQWFYNNRVIGYPNMLFSAILRTDQSLEPDEIVYDQRAYDNYAKISRSALGYWSILNKTAKLNDLDFYDNEINFISAPTQAEFTAAGVRGMTYPTDLSASIFTTWIEGDTVSGVTYLAEVLKGITIRDNIQYASDDLLLSQRVSMVRFVGCYVRENLKIKNNSLQLNCLLNRDVSTGTVNDYFDGWFIKGNDIDFSKHKNQYNSFYIFLEYMKNCVFDFDLNTNFPFLDKTYNLVNLNFADSTKVKNNAIKINPNKAFKTVDSWLGGSLLSYEEEKMQAQGNYVNTVAYVYIEESRESGKNLSKMGVQSGSVPPSASVAYVLDYTENMLPSVSYPVSYSHDYSGSYKLTAFGISFSEHANTDKSDRFAYMNFICS